MQALKNDETTPLFIHLRFAHGLLSPEDRSESGDSNVDAGDAAAGWNH